MYPVIEEGGFFIGKYRIYRLSDEFQLKICTFEKDQDDDSEREWWGFVLQNHLYCEGGVTSLNECGLLAKDVRFDIWHQGEAPDIDLIFIKERKFPDVMKACLSILVEKFGC